MNKKTILLCILDGFGLGKKYEGNAISNANTPNIDMLSKEYISGELIASGTQVGLPDGQEGNSEVGHLNIGSGRIVYQTLSLINESIKTGEFFKNKELTKTIKHSISSKKALHILGLLSDGGTHSHIDHIFATIKMAHKLGVKELAVHVWLDGRDTPRTNGIKYLKLLQKELKKYGPSYILGTISGRYYAMDRDKRWSRIEKAYNSMIDPNYKSFDDPIKYINESYKNDIFDEFIVPARNVNCNHLISDNSSVICCNFRPDRVIQIMSTITNNKYEFKPTKQLHNVQATIMVKYSDSVNALIAFQKIHLKNTLGEWLANNNFHQLRIAETEKYAHVTFFFDGGETKEFNNTKKILVPSPDVKTYDLKPEMSVYELKDKVLKELKKDYLDVIILNIANCDMVGHTGKYSAAVKAVEAVDECVGELYQEIKETGSTMIITGDHGNADEMILKDGSVSTSHSYAHVPFIVTNNNYSLTKKVGKLSDIAPTMIYLLGKNPPKEMTGDILLKARGNNESK